MGFAKIAIQTEGMQEYTFGGIQITADEMGPPQDLPRTHMSGHRSEAETELAVAQRLDRNGLAARFAAAALARGGGDATKGNEIIRATIAELAPRLGGRAGRRLLAAAGMPTPTKH